MEPAAKKKILIVDDDKFLLDMYAIKFGQSGFEVEVAFGGAEALSKLEGGLSPDVVLFDIAMPGMEGTEFLANVREKNYVPHATMIALSNQNEPADMEKCRSLGIDDYLIKATLTPLELIDRVRDIISKTHHS